MQHRRRAASRTASSYTVQLALRCAEFLPPGDGTPFRINKPLLEDVVEDILEVEEVRSITDVDELCGHLFALLEVGEEVRGIADVDELHGHLFALLEVKEVHGIADVDELQSHLFALLEIEEVCSITDVDASVDEPRNHLLCDMQPILLLLAVKHRMQGMDMVKQRFVFPDMQSDQMTGTWRTSRAGRRTTTRPRGVVPTLGTMCLRSCTGILPVSRRCRLRRSGRVWQCGTHEQVRPCNDEGERTLRCPTNRQSQRDLNTMDINVISFGKEERVSEEEVGGPHGLDRGREKGVNGQRCFQCGPQGHSKNIQASRKGVAALGAWDHWQAVRDRSVEVRREGPGK